MKGIVFTEFLEMVEEKFDFETVDSIIENANLPSGGSYTAIGTYDHTEIVSLLVELHKITGVAVADLLRTYGEHLFGKFVQLYPVIFEKATDAFGFLESIHGYIHKEVLKLYPDAELPSFETERREPNQLIMHYRSERHMGEFAYGLIMGCLKHFDEKATIEMTPIDEIGSEVLFTIRRE